ncbi:hypothetical protein PQD76_gp39 [Stenotrophomonas phage BUCT626]|uniref:Uncharacterized protein n=1 Tax=Stenotrophomonas phage BUCT626 TaxID=2860376 RepID=A0AC61NLW2_9CAUD|nr:hypothetical protein PQD76_gp39 [Stenotrophomonas phage BUCT626]QYC96743.1 hypothetical protein [Stenotrophomonas phage BUCT626]
MKAILKKDDLEVGKTYTMIRNGNFKSVSIKAEVKMYAGDVCIEVDLGDGFNPMLMLDRVSDICRFIEFN